jgi:hypothetical protein
MAAQAAEPDSGPAFKKPDISAHIPPELKDTVDRIVAAGMKIMYAPQMRGDLMKAVQSQEPTPKVLAENITGLMLAIDQKAGKSGLPPPAVFPAAMELFGDAATVLTQAGKQVSQNDYDDGLRMLYVMLGKKMGGTDAQIMDAANKSLPPDKQVAGGAPPDGPAADASQAAAVPPAAPPGAPPVVPPVPPEQQPV